MTEHRIKPSKDLTHIVLKVVGEFDGQAMMEYIIEAHSLGKELGINNYLLDVTEARNTASTISNYQFASSKIKQQKGINHQANIVALINEKDHSHDFVTTVLCNTGQPIQVCTDPDIAISYFKKK